MEWNEEKKIALHCVCGIENGFILKDFGVTLNYRHNEANIYAN